MIFPPLEAADENGLLAIGGELSVATLLQAYQNGIFPWPVPGYPLLWFAPPERAILEFAELTIPQRVQRDLKKNNWRFTINQDFVGVVKACAQGKTRKKQSGTWITPAIIKAYTELFEQGHVLCFEAYNQKNKLVGGMYGVKIKNYFSAESMFYLESGASKFVLLQAVQYLKNQGWTWMDVQVISPLLKTFGAKDISREQFMDKLSKALN